MPPWFEIVCAIALLILLLGIADLLRGILASTKRIEDRLADKQKKERG